MKCPVRLFDLVVILSAAAFFPGCVSSPSEVLAEIEDSASRGDAAAFASHFTSESRPFAEALIRMQKDVRKDEPGKSPLENIFHSKVVSENIQDDVAVVQVSGPAGTSGIVFVREGGAWKLDVAATELERAEDAGAPK